MLLYEKTKQEKILGNISSLQSWQEVDLGFEPEDVSVGQALIQLL